MTPFAKIQNDREMFDGGRGRRQAAAEADAFARECFSAGSHDRSAGRHGARRTPPTRTQQMIEDMIRIFEAQRLVSLNTLFDLADNLESVGRGEKLNTALAGKLASAHLAKSSCRAALCPSEERTALSFGYWTDRHIEARAQAESARGDRKGGERSAEAEGSARSAGAVPARYAGGLQLHSLRSAGRAGAAHQSAVCAQPRFHRHRRTRNQTWKATEVYGTGWPANAGGRLVGSLASLPYALAEAEQNFLIPSARTGADLGRPGSADDPQRRDPALVERDASAASLGGTCTWRTPKRCWPRARS